GAAPPRPGAVVGRPPIRAGPGNRPGPDRSCHLVGSRSHRPWGVCLPGWSRRLLARLRGEECIGARVGLVLGAGGVVGHAFHAGVLRALAEVTGWDPRRAEVVVGTSAGAPAGAVPPGRPSR